MIVSVDALERASSLGEVAELTQSAEWKKYLVELSKRANAEDEVARLRRAVADARTRLSPEHANPELQALKELVYRDAAAGPDEKRRLLSRISALRAALPMRQHEMTFGRLETAVGQMFVAENSGTGYSNRARRARDLFTEYAGTTRIADADTDKHGNADGTRYDLGRDGAFTGHTVHVLHFYSGEGFNFKQPGAAFTRKGFGMERWTDPGTPEGLRAWLADAHQLWVISHSKAFLTHDHIAVILDFWRRGGALYIWGDNDPYYVDANALLKAMFGADFSMLGNTPGGKVVHEISPAMKGFNAHLVTTGLVHLFEGITVASLKEDIAAKYGFAPLLYGSAGNLITVVRDPTPAAGAVMIDTAFTRLYCQWDEAGSARYVCNAACFLAAMTLPAEPEVEETAESPEKTSEPALRYDPAGAFAGVCDLTAEAPTTWLVLSVAELADPLRNTSDAVLTDPLCAGARNLVFSDQIYGEQMGQWIIAQGTDPFTRKSVAECLPLVDLSIRKNLNEFTVLLCKCLMGGKYLPTAARLVFFAVIDQMLDPARGADHPEAWEYLYRQCLANFTSTPEFSEVGRPMPLLDAMVAFFSPATDEMVQLRRSFSTVGVIGRTLLRERRATKEQVHAIARRSLLKSLVADAVGAEKAAPGSVKPEILCALYDNFCGIPKLDGGRVVTARMAFQRESVAARERVEREVGRLLSDEDFTLVLYALQSLDLRQYTAESAVERLLAHAPEFARVWRTQTGPEVREVLNRRFAAYAEGVDLTEAHMASTAPFATTYGPSVYRCQCGLSFGDPRAEVTDESLLALRVAREEHFRKVYRIRGAGSYPCEGSLHSNLHRAVQRVVKDRFNAATEPTREMVVAVAEYLRDDGKGFVCKPTLEAAITSALGSYLGLRRTGEAHPEGVLTLQVKAERERTLTLSRQTR